MLLEIRYRHLAAQYERYCSGAEAEHNQESSETLQDAREPKE
jgi:hypothetical protein